MWPDLESREIGNEQESEEPWTEIWDHLISREAIDKLGYDFERTKYYFYIKKRLSRVSIDPHRRLVFIIVVQTNVDISNVEIGSS